MSLQNLLLVAPCVVLLGTQAAPAEEQVIPISRLAKAACMADAIRLCRNAVPNVQNVLICFGQHRDKISNRCRTVLASYGFQ